MIAAVVTIDSVFAALALALVDTEYIVGTFDTVADALRGPVAMLIVDAAIPFGGSEWDAVRAAAPPLVLISSRAELELKLAARQRAEQEHQSELLAERMDALRTFAHGAAHEINNPLAYNAANIQLVSEALTTRQSPDDVELIEALEEAYDGALRVRDLVRELRMFSQADPLLPEGGAVDLTTVIERSIRLASAELQGRARVTTDLADVPFVFGKDALFAQLFLQLLTNAARAYAAHDGNAAEQVVSIFGHTRADGRVCIEVVDRGVGMTPAVRTRMFDPFFTTRPVGGGVGLGLSLCTAIMSAVRGSIEVESTPGHGTTVRVFLEAATRPIVRRRILVIDDEPAVAAALHRALGTEHDLTTVDNTRDGLSRIESDDYDLILCDVAMPEMSGIALYTELSRRCDVAADRMLFLAPLPSDEISEGTSAFLAQMSGRSVVKPIDADGLRALLHRRWDKS